MSNIIQKKQDEYNTRPVYFLIAVTNRAIPRRRDDQRHTKASNCPRMHIRLVEEVLQIFEEFLDLGSLSLNQSLIQLAQQLLLLLGQLGGGFHHNGEPVVTTAAGIANFGDTLIPQDEFLAGLGALGIS